MIATLIVVAATSALYVRFQAEQDARQAASAAATFAAQKAAAQLTAGFDLIRSVSTPVVGSAALAQAYSDPTKCSLGYAPVGAFSTGHIDLVRPDGSIACSSLKTTVPGPARVFAGQSWLVATSEVVVAPVADPESGNQVAVAAFPVVGLGVLAWFLDLVPVGPHLESDFGNSAHNVEFVVVAKDGRTVIARSVKPAQSLGMTIGNTAVGPAREDLNGTRRLYGYSAISTVGWGVYAGADESAAIAAADSLSNRLFVIILVGASVVMAVLFVFLRQTTEPIMELRRRVGRGRPYDSPPPATGGKGAAEIAALSDELDRLMETVNYDLSERLHSEQAARDSEQNYRMLFEGHPQPMWLYDTETLAFLKVNDAAVKQYGYSRDEFLTMKIPQLSAPNDLAKHLELVSRPLPSFDRTGPWCHMMKDGSIVQVLVTSHALRFDEHNARFVIAEDLTDSQRLELELLQSQARAEGSAELGRAKDEMVSTVSHEMRTPLASIVGFTELMVTREVTPEHRREYLAIMLQEGRRLTALINDFLDIRRIEEGGSQILQLAPADIKALIDRAIVMLGDSTTPPIVTNFQANLPLVRVDSDSVFRVLANLLSNACKYSPDGGSITVSARAVDGNVEVTVQDHGLGIPPESLSQMFAKFYRVETPDRRAIRGTGLGLAICKNIVEAHGGKITVRSQGLGQGTTFSFTVPAVKKPAIAGDVLLVEDDSGFAHLLEAELSARGLSSIWAPDAETAERLVATTTPRAVVLDLVLPGLSGEEFLTRLRASRGAALPVVVVTVKSLDQAETLSLQKAGVMAILRKGPGSAEATATMIEESLARQAVAL
ncbi:MAG TPA: ATP-binding protein [Candidatus Baltobacterales bacterium]|nr:ATP-binding protein [Candidatus Baltobacterales bacterium]